MICPACGKTGIRSVLVLKDHRCPTMSDWGRVMKLRQNGEIESAERLARRLLGVKGEPMDDETKEKLRQWKEEHAEEIKARSEVKRQARERLEAMVAPAKGELRRKR